MTCADCGERCKGYRCAICEVNRRMQMELDERDAREDIPSEEGEGE